MIMPNTERALPAIGIGRTLTRTGSTMGRRGRGRGRVGRRRGDGFLGAVRRGRREGLRIGAGRGAVTVTVGRKFDQ